MVQLSHVGGVLSRWGNTVAIRTNAAVFVMMLLFSLVAFSAGAQQELPSASVNEAGILQIPADQPLNTSYMVDVSHLNFGSDNDMVAFFATKSGDNYLVRAIPHLNRAIVHLQLKKQPEWTREQWNSHLATETAIRPIAQ